MWKSDCSDGCEFDPCGHDFLTRQPFRQSLPLELEMYSMHFFTLYPFELNASAGHAVLQGFEQLIQTPRGFLAG